MRAYKFLDAHWGLKCLYERRLRVTDLPPISAGSIIRHSHSVIGPLFLYHAQSESSAVFVLVSSRLAANSQAISFGVLSPSAL